MNLNPFANKKRDIKVVLENPITEKQREFWDNDAVREKYHSALEKVEHAKAFMGLTRGGIYGFSVAFNGEKDLGGIGPLVDYHLDYEGFRSRSWKSYLDSEIAQTVLGRYRMWVIGNGLKLQAEPMNSVLSKSKIELSEEDFNDTVEARFSLFANSSIADYSGMSTLNQIAASAFLNSKVGGDVLVILRLVDGNVTVQLVDGAHVQNPIGSSPYIAYAETAGNILKNGIEIDKKGQHVAYYVRKRGIDNNGTNDMSLDFDSERIPARSKSSGLVTAFLVNGLQYRIDNVRSLPLIAAVMQTMTTMERYKEATLGAAEEAAKIVMAIEHEIFSDESDPFASVIQHARNHSNSDKIPVNNDGQQIADKIAVTTGKSVFNLGRGQSLKSFTGGKELYFKDFYTVNIDLVCATVGIPPAVAMSKYDTSYSSSRAAIKDWEHTLNVERKLFATQFYQRVYDFWLDVEVLKGNINAPGYTEARLKNDLITLSAYRRARFVGASVPHIDPLKEVQAQRLLLGPLAKNAPLTTMEAATEALNNGDSDSNIEQFAVELEYMKKLNIKPDEIPDDSGSVTD